ncbi:MAG: hypothetical protein HYZ50_05230 [Deltaproteobacteria bacterium]|nr:hypothetical protein [Deltaproteobacteria bacterium]
MYAIGTVDRPPRLIADYDDAIKAATQWARGSGEYISVWTWNEGRRERYVTTISPTPVHWSQRSYFPRLQAVLFCGWVGFVLLTTAVMLLWKLWEQYVMPHP